MRILIIMQPDEYTHHVISMQYKKSCESYQTLSPREREELGMRLACILSYIPYLNVS